MEISSVGSANLAGQTLMGRTTQSSELYASSKSPEVEKSNHHERDGQPKTRGHDGHHGDSGRQGLSALRQEIRLLLSSSFQMSFSKSASAYSEIAGEQSPGAVAAETLGVAKEIAARAPLQAAETLVDMRSKIDVAAKDVRDSIGAEPREDLDGAIDLVSKGLDDLEKDAARNVVSSASVLSAESQTKQRSTIRIRTQEGDVIKLSLRNVERMSVEDTSVSDGESTRTSTEIQISSRSRMALSVKGDLNEAEMTAIKSVFAQAEAIANEFFGGDLAAAFDMAAGLEYDTEQLAKINMQFRERQMSSVAYAVSDTRPVVVAQDADPVIAGSAKPIVESVAPVPVAVATPASESESASTETAPVTSSEVAPAVAAASNDAMDNFFDLLGSFLNSLNEGFESDSGQSSFRFFHSQSFNLQILKTVFEVSAPEESGDAAKAAATIVDTLSE